MASLRSAATNAAPQHAPPVPASRHAPLADTAGRAPAAESRGEAAGEPGGADIWQKFPQFAHHVEEAELLLGDNHSRGFYITALKRLYPGHMGVWQRALGLAREQQGIRRSRGALFTRLLRTFAAEAGVSL